MNVFNFNLQRFADNTIDNTLDAVQITGTTQADSITNSGSDVTIDADGGDDLIENDGSNVIIKGGAGEGNDTVKNSGRQVTIEAGTGNDSISTSNSSSVKCGDGNDTITVQGANSTIDCGAGDDYIYSLGLFSAKNIIEAGAGNDYIQSSRMYVVNAGDGDDSIENNSGENSTINAGAGNDSIYSYGDSVSICGDDGNDSISNGWGDSVTINGGAGDDRIVLGKDPTTNLIEYASGDGNDSIVGFNSTSTLSIAGNSYSSLKSGNDVILTVGDEKIFLLCAASLSTLNIIGTYEPDTTPGGVDTTPAALNITNPVNKLFIIGSDFSDTIQNSGANVTVKAGDGDDSIRNSGANVSIDAGGGNDAIHNVAVDNCCFDLGVGNDSILNYGDNAILIGNEGNDTIDNSASNVSINAGDGNDEIHTEGRNFSINGGNGDDSITNYGKNVTINGGAGNDQILIFSHTNDNIANVSIDSGEDNDTIRNGCSNVTINAGDGNDFILNYVINASTNSNGGTTVKIKSGDNSSINGGAGNDVIYNSGSNVTIDGGAGTDFVSLSSDAISNLIEYASGDGNDIIEGFNATSTLQIGDGTGTYSTHTSGSDIVVKVGDNAITLRNAASLKSSIHILGEEQSDEKIIQGLYTADNLNNSLNGVTILAYDGNDTITNSGSNVSIDAGDGDDSINNYGSNVTIDGGDGKDYIYNRYDSVTIDGGAGDDSIRNWGDSVTIDGGDGNDSIDNDVGANVTIDGGDGNDYIDNGGILLRGDSVSINGGDSVTIDGGAGNDSIRNSGDSVKINGGAGDDTIYNDGVSTVTIDGGETVTIDDGGATVINVGGSSVIVTIDVGANVTIDGGDGKDYIYNRYDSVTIDGGAGDDYICNDLGGSVTMDGGAGNDSIRNNYGGSVTMDGGAGNDTITNVGRNVSISGGKGNDRISLGSYAENNLIEYTAGDGNDIVYGFNETSTLKISGEKYSSVKSGNDIIITVGEGSVLLKDAANLSAADIHIDGTFASGGSEPELPAGISINNGKLEVSSNFKGKKVDANEFPVEIEVIDASNFKSKIEIVGNAANNTIKGGKDNDTLTGNDDVDTFAMSGGKDIVTDYTAGVDKILVDGTPSVTSVTVNNKTGDTVIQVGRNSLTLKKLDEEDVSAGKVLTFTDGTNDTMRTYFSDKIVDGNSVTLQPAFKGTFDGTNFAKVDASNVKVGVKIIGGNSSNVLGSAKNDTLLGNNSTLTGDKGSDVFISESSATITDYETSDKISLGADISDVAIDGDNVVLTFGENSLTIQDAADKKVTLLDGKKSTAYIFDKHAIFDGSKKAVTLTAGDNFDAANYSALVTIDASQTDGATITGNSKANKVSLGDGENVFIWAGGNDTLTNFGADDTLSINGEVSDATATKGNSVFNVGKNKITVKDSAQVIFKDDGGTKIFSAGIFTDADETSATLPASFSQQNTKTPLPLDYATINASNVKKALNLSLDDDNDSIHGGKKGDSIHGGDGNDTLWGGAGNDSLWGDSGADTFIYSKGDGKDVIFGFDDTDMIEIIGLGDNVTGTLNNKGTELAVKVGKTAVAVLKDFTATTFNINGDTYQLSGKALVKA